MKTEVITRNSQNQPVFLAPINEPGFVGFRFKGRDYLMSILKAEEILSELQHAVEIARKP